MPPNNSFIEHPIGYLKLYLNWENSFFGSKKHFFDIQSKKKFLWIKVSFVNLNKFSLFQRNRFVTLKKIFLNQQNFLQFGEIFSLTVHQRNVSFI